MWSQGSFWAAFNVALKHITHPRQTQMGSLPGGLRWMLGGWGVEWGGQEEREREREGESWYWEGREEGRQCTQSCVRVNVSGGGGGRVGGQQSGFLWLA